MDKDSFLAACRENNLVISDSQAALLQLFIDTIRTYNKRVNLISRKDEENIWEHHILHCVSLLFHRKFPPGTHILDLGTGGGLPGIVFAILHPASTFSLLDATKKKINAVHDVVEILGLTNVTTVWGRAEEVGKKPQYAARFDNVVARAVAPLEKLVKWSKPFLALKNTSEFQIDDLIPSGALIAFKGGDIADELQQVRQIRSIKNIDVLQINKIEDKKVLFVRYSSSSL